MLRVANNTIETIEQEDLCRHCHKNKISDELIGLCADCSSDYYAAIDSTMERVDVASYPNLSQEQRDTALRETGADFNVHHEDTDEYVYRTYFEPELDTYDDEEEDIDKDELDNDDNQEEEEEKDRLIDILVDEDLPYEDRVEKMVKYLEKIEEEEDCLSEHEQTDDIDDNEEEE